MDGLIIVVKDFIEADHVIAGGLAVTKLLVARFLLVAAILIQTEGRLSRRRRLSGLEGRRLLVGAR